jgi:hypothetical protein
MRGLNRFFIQLIQDTGISRRHHPDTSPKQDRISRVILCTIGIVLLHIATTDDDNDRAAATESIAQRLVTALESVPHRMRGRRDGMRAGMHDAWNGNSSPG